MKRLLKSKPIDQAVRGAALVVTDRRWAAPLSAAALGFGIFAGVAIGPGAPGTLAGGPQLIEVPSPGGSAEEVHVAGAGPDRGGGVPAGPPDAGFVAAPPEPLPIAPTPPQSVPVEDGPAPEPASPPAREEEEPLQEEAIALEGVVAQANPAAGSYALAIAGGEVVPIHAATLPAAGARLTVDVVPLVNGSFGEKEKPKSTGRAGEVELSGVVTYLDSDPAFPFYTLSGRGVSLPIQVGLDAAGALPELPEVGTRVSVKAAIEPVAILVQRQIEVEDAEPVAYLEMAGVLTGVVPESSEILLTADGAGESGAELVLAVPRSIDATKLKLGHSYLVSAEVEEDGSLALVGIASDEGRKGAADPASAQGDLKR